MRNAAGSAQSLTYEDAQAISDELGSLIVGVAPERTVGGAQIISGGQNWQTRIIGVTPSYEDVRNFHVASGEFITQTELDGKSAVIVLGAG